MLKLINSHDSERVLRLFLSVFTHEPWNDKWESDRYALAYISDLMDNQNSLSFGWFCGDRLIGLCLGHTYHWWQGKEYFIQEFCIAREDQGKGQGKQFLGSIEEYVKSLSISCLWLSTDRDVPAYGFYKALGYVEQKQSVQFAKRIP
jgi:aminoglycoside 6'-N-acetyltransferase I